MLRRSRVVKVPCLATFWCTLVFVDFVCGVLESVAHVVAAALYVDVGIPLQHTAVYHSHALLELAI